MKHDGTDVGEEANKSSNEKCITLNVVKFHGAFIFSLSFGSGIMNNKAQFNLCADFSICTYAYIMRIFRT